MNEKQLTTVRKMLRDDHENGQNRSTQESVKICQSYMFEKVMFYNLGKYQVQMLQTKDRTILNQSRESKEISQIIEI